MKIPVSRPRVYLIDFEVAVEFPPNFTAAECVVTGYPLGGSFHQPEMYARPLPSELTAGEPYSPFKLDVWQLGISFSQFKVGESSLSFTAVVCFFLRASNRLWPFADHDCSD